MRSRARRVDAVVFTSAVQVKHLFAVAERMGRGGRAARAACAGSSSPRSGPVCSRALEERGITPDVRGRSAQAGAADCASEGGARHIAASRLPVSGSRRQRNSPDSYAGPPFRTIRRNTPMV